MPSSTACAPLPARPPCPAAQAERLPLLPAAPRSPSAVRSPATACLPAPSFGGAAYAERRGKPAPALPRLFVTPPTPLPQPVYLASPSRHVAGQAYAALGCYGLSLAAATLAVDPTNGQVLVVGVAALAALMAAAGILAQAGWTGRGPWSPWLLATGSAHAAVLGAALAPAGCVARSGAPTGQPSGPGCPQPAAGVATFVAVSAVASLLWTAASCAHWRGVAAQLRGGRGTLRARDDTWTAPLTTASLVAVCFGTLAVTVGLAEDDGVLTGVGCLLWLMAPALATLPLASAPPRAPV